METFSKCEMTSIRDLFFSSCSRRDGLSACAQLLAKWIQWDDAFLETESRGWGEEKKVKSLSCVWLFVIPWTVVNQAPPFMGLSRQGYWNELPFPSLGDLPNPGIELGSPTLRAESLPTEPPGKPKNTGVGSLSLLQGIYLTQELNWGLLHCRRILYQLSYEESPTFHQGPQI